MEKENILTGGEGGGGLLPENVGIFQKSKF